MPWFAVLLNSVILLTQTTIIKLQPRLISKVSQATMCDQPCMLIERERLLTTPIRTKTVLLNWWPADSRVTLLVSYTGWPRRNIWSRTELPKSIFSKGAFGETVHIRIPPSSRSLDLRFLRPMFKILFTFDHVVLFLIGFPLYHFSASNAPLLKK